MRATAEAAEAGAGTPGRFDDVPGFVARLRQEDDIASQALEFLILTAARSGEVFGARLSEFDLDVKTWTVPAKRTKGSREHRVPLSERATAIARNILAAHSDEFVFPGARPGKHLSSMALAMTLRRMNVDCTVHGSRCAFRDWAGERTQFAREIAEAALAHIVGDARENRLPSNEKVLTGLNLEESGGAATSRLLSAPGQSYHFPRFSGTR